MGWPAAPRGGRQVVGRGSNPAAVGILPWMEREAEGQRAPKRRGPGEISAAFGPAVFHAAGPLLTPRPPDGDWPVAANGSITEVWATIATGADVDLLISVYVILNGSDALTLVGIYTLTAGARQDRWGLDRRVRNGDRITVGVDLAGDTEVAGSGLTVAVFTS